MAFDHRKSQAATWISMQLSLADDDETKVYDKDEIDAEIEQHAEGYGIARDEADWLKESLVEYKERYRLLAWNEILHEGNEFILELQEATQSTAAVTREVGTIIMPDGHVFSVIPDGSLIRIHKLIIVRVNDKTGDDEILEEVKISQTLDKLADSGEGYSLDDLHLAVESWVKAGGCLDEILDGPPYYLLDEHEHQ